MLRLRREMSVYCASQAEAKGLKRFEEAVGRRVVHVRAGGKSLTVPALQVQNRLVHPSMTVEMPPFRAEMPEKRVESPPACETAQRIQLLAC
jgi:hypothetical protein